MERVIINETMINEYRGQQNACYEAFYCGKNGEATAIIQKRVNTTTWESQTSGCNVYECDNITGPIQSGKNCTSEILNDENKPYYINENLKSMEVVFIMK